MRKTEASAIQAEASCLSLGWGWRSIVKQAILRRLEGLTRRQNGSQKIFFGEASRGGEGGVERSVRHLASRFEKTLRP